MKFLLVCLAVCFPLAGHVGVNDVFFEGLAGPYPLYITIRPPVVIPGVAEISIRSAARDVKSIEIAPMTLTGAGSKYPPTPDRALPVKEDPQTFTGGLWIMSPGSWQVKTTVDGARGRGVVSVPVRAASQKVTRMDPFTGGVLVVLMLILAVGIVGIAGAAVREAQLPPGASVPADRAGRSRIAMVCGAAIAALTLWFGNSWWNSESQAYASSIYKPLKMEASVSGRQLRLVLQSSGWMQPKAVDDLIEDHGHLMHLYLVRDPKLDAVFHVHPKKLEPGKFIVNLPEMPSGSYRLFADIVHGSGFPETLTAAVELAEPSEGPGDSPDDAGTVFTTPEQPKQFGSVTFLPPEKIRSGEPLTLRFQIKDPDGNPAANLKPYLGMPAHLAIIKSDFSVFSHIHPHGNVSMAAFELAQLNNPRSSSDVLVSSHVNEGQKMAIPAEFGFPFGFPSPGEYLMVLQFARQNVVETVPFRLRVKE